MNMDVVFTSNDMSLTPSFENVQPVTVGVDWEKVLNKPDEFPPSDHTHDYSELLNAPTAIDGEDGVSPLVKTTVINGGHRVTITDKDGEKSFDVMDGKQGIQGEPGRDAVSPVIETSTIVGGHRVTIKNEGDTKTFNVMDGVKGDKGDPGEKGNDGVSPVVNVSKTDGVTTVSITDKNGLKTATIKDGENTSSNLVNGIETGSIRSVGASKEEGGYRLGQNSVAFGNNAKASGGSSVAEGINTTSSGGASHAEGRGTTASGLASHAEGEQSVASGFGSHAEGIAKAIGDLSHAEGQSEASGIYSHSEGTGTKAQSNYQHVQGQWNIPDPDNKYAHIVGNGDSINRGNAHTVDWDGNAWYQGDVYVGGTSQDDAEKLVKQSELEDALSNFEGGVGNDGFSPTIDVKRDGTSTRLTITDVNGTKTATIEDGKDGTDGKDGYTPVKGVDYFDGADGQPGTNGQPGVDGVSPTVSTTSIADGHRVSITDKNGTKTFELFNGAEGKPGEDGVSPTVTASKSGKVTTLTITDKNGTKTTKIYDGADGTGGGGGVPSSGIPNQMLVTDADGNTTWDDRPVYSTYVEQTILPETTLTYSEDFSSFMLETEITLELNKTYTVTWNGVEYESTYREITAEGQTNAILGNVAPLGVGADTGEPFILMLQDMGEGVYGLVMPFDGAESVTLSISFAGEVTKKLDMKYLPDGYPNEEVGLVEILPETSFVGEGTEWMTTEPLNGSIEAGKTYAVNYNGTPYTCVCSLFEGMMPCLGNIGAMTGEGDTGEPFIFVVVPDAMKEQSGGATAMVMPLDEASEVVVSVSGEGKTIKKIDMKYLPDGFPYATDADKVVVPYRSWSQKNEMFPVLSNMHITPGTEYKVTFQGNEYKCIASNNQDAFLGDFVGFAYITESGECLFRYLEYSNPEVAAFLGTSTFVQTDNSSLTDIEFGIVEPKGTVYTIDPKYLPKDTSGTWVSGTGLGSVRGRNAAEEDEFYKMGFYAFAYGEKAKAEGRASVAVGDTVYAHGVNSSAEGWETIAVGPQSHAEGRGHVIYSQTPQYITGEKGASEVSFSGNNIPEVYDILEFVDDEGGNCFCYVTSVESNKLGITPKLDYSATNVEVTVIKSGSFGGGSHSEGLETRAFGNSSHSEGYRTIAVDECAHSEGYSSKAIGRQSHAEGNNCIAAGNNSHAQGNGTVADGMSMSASGEYNQYETLDKYSIEVTERVRGWDTDYGFLSRATSAPVVNTETCMFVFGNDPRVAITDIQPGDIVYDGGTVVYYDILSIEGATDERINFRVREHFIRNNRETRGKYIHVVGNGTSDGYRHNAHTLDWKGNAWYAGTVEGTAMILSSPNGTRFRVTVDNDGTLSASAITE